MKKRIFSLALVLCFVLTFAAMASASGMEVYLTTTTAQDYNDDFGNPMVGEEYEEKSINFTFCDTAHKPYTHSSNTSTYYIGDFNTTAANIASSGTKQLLLTGDSEQGLIISVGDPVEFSSGNKKGSYAAVTLKGTPAAKGSYKFRLVRKTGSTTTNTDFTITVKEVVQLSTSAPTFKTTTNPTGAHGKPFSFTIQANNNVDPESDSGYSMVSIVDDEDADNAVLSATELENYYGITLSNNDSGDLILTADALMAPTSTDVTITFVAAVSNDFTWWETYENEAGEEYAAEIEKTGDYEIEKTYTLKITPITPAIVKISVDQKALGSKTDLGTYPVSEDKVIIWVETNYTSASSGDVLYATGFPAGLTFEMSKDEEEVVYVEVSDDCEEFTVPIQKYYYKLYGTPDKASSSTITITPQNYDYNVKGTARSGLKMTVLDKPSLTSPAEGKDLTSIAYGKTGYSQSLTLKGGDTKTYKPYVLTSAKYLPTFLTVSSKDSKITGNFSTLAHTNALKTVIGELIEDEVDWYADLEEVPEDGFGEYASISFDVVLDLSCDIFSEVVSASRKIVISTVKPAFSKTQKDIQTELDNANLKANEDFSGITLTASAPGTITWSHDELPDGIYLNGDEDGEELTPDKTANTLNSVVTLSGTPTAPIKNKSVKITASNGAGSTTITLKFNVSAPTPKIKYQTYDSESGSYEDVDDNVNPISGDMKVGDTFNVRVYNGADGAGATKFTQKGLPSGLTLTADGDDAAIIKGTLKSATKSETTFTLTAQDQDSTAKPSASDSSTYNVYAKPKISGKLGDITVGKYDLSSTVKADTVTTWYLSETIVEAVNGATEITEDGVQSNLPGNIVSASVSTNSKGVVELKILRFVDTVPTETSQTVRVWAENKAGAVSADLTYKIKGEKVKITTSKFDSKFTTGAEGSETIKFTGSPTIESLAYIAASDAEKEGWGSENIILTSTAEEITGYKLSYSNGTLTKGAETPVHKGIKITVSADNGLGEVKKTLTLTINGMDPKWLYGTDNVNVTGKTLGTGKGTQDYEKNLLTYDVATAKDEIITLTVSGDSPIEITYGTLPAGISLDISDTTVKILYEVNGSAKAGTNKVALTAKNTATGKSAKVNVQLTAQQSPTISNKEDLLKGKEIQQGKKLSLKATLSPADKSATWAIVSAEVPFDGSEITGAEVASDYGITIDSKGVIGGTTKKVTSADGGGADFMKLLIWVSNDAGEDYAYANVKITGSKPKIDSKTKTFTFTRNVELTDDNVSADKRTIMAQGIASDDMKMVLETAELAKLTALGSTMSIDAHGEISGKPTAGTKGQTIKVSADHFGARAYLSVKFIVLDPEATLTPYDGESVISSPDYISMPGTVNDKKKVTEAVEKEITVKLSSAATDTPTWKIAKKPSYNGLTAKITAKDNESATILLTLKKNATATLSGDSEYKPVETYFTISAQNKSNKKTATTDPIYVKITFSGEDSAKKEEVTNENSDVKEANDKEDELVEEELTKELGEGDLSIGAERTDSALTDEQKAAIKAEGYMIAAILPEISATVDGQYGLEVDLLADVPAGSELKWLAYPQSPAAPSEDDEIADFFDIDGADTTTVPADHIVLVYPWLREGVKYAPVIVAKVSEAAPGDVVSEEGIDEAVEKAKEGEESTEEIVLDEEGKTTEAPAENQETTTETPAEKPANDESKPEETSTEAQSE